MILQIPKVTIKIVNISENLIFLHLGFLLAIIISEISLLPSGLTLRMLYGFTNLTRQPLYNTFEFDYPETKCSNRSLSIKMHCNIYIRNMFLAKNLALQWSRHLLSFSFIPNGIKNIPQHTASLNLKSLVKNSTESRTTYAV